MEKQRIIVSNETLISITTVFSDIACAQQCLCTATCCSASYEIETKKCQLNSCCNPEIQPSENGIIIQQTGISTHEEQCIESSGFIYNASADICYYIGPEMDMHFTYINALCPLMGSKLIAIDSQVKQIFVQKILEEQGRSTGDKVVYSCIPGFVAISGDLEHVCCTSLSWEGINPVCIQIVGGQNTDRGYKKNKSRFIKLFTAASTTSKVKFKLQKKCNKDSLCNSYTFDDSVKTCHLYKFDMTGSNLVCSGSDICYIRYS
ncbi:CSMD [Mytilus coruscus]|uniref:CSMD n=1 Tax=Mytilus coruscus TaxID=42192 RepID=A0A6J8BHW1_MYTCO|nr:CSMD [Mytilus coruscus]